MPALSTYASTFRDQAKRSLLQARFDGPGTAHVLLFDSTPWRSFHDNAVCLLPSSEQERSHRLRQTQHRDTYVIAHALWRLALGDLLGVEAMDVPLTSTAAGQPQLEGTGYATSLSHSGAYVAIAIGRTTNIGIDIEQSPPRAGLRDLTSVLCTPTEAAALEQLPPDQRELALLSLWARKEALLKAFGVGLREAPTSIEADIGVTIEPPASINATACRIHPLALPPGLIGALAAPSDITVVTVHRPTPPDTDGDRVES